VEKRKRGEDMRSESKSREWMTRGYLRYVIGLRELEEHHEIPIRFFYRVARSWDSWKESAALPSVSRQP
jgi:hypothetical protein